MSRNLRPLTVFLGPPPNELDAARAVHRPMYLSTPDDHGYTVCSVCYMHDEEWPCVTATLVARLDELLAIEKRAWQAA